jgi:hypothetical protein
MGWLHSDAVVGVFDDREEADLTRDELLQAGFPPYDIEIMAAQVAAPDPMPFATEKSPIPPRIRGRVVIGAMIGVLIGCLAGTLIASGAIGMGPMMRDKALAAIAGAVGGAVLLGMLGGLIAWAGTADERSFYAQELHSGRTVVMIHHPVRPAEALTIMQRHHATRIRAPHGMRNNRVS